MRVLMFGWEFPPYLSGGLATATVGLVKGLLRRNVAVTLVVPFPVEDPATPGFKLVSATWGAERLRRVRVPTPALPYAGEEEYALARDRLAGTRGQTVYGADLFGEVERLAAIAGDIAAREPHDVIHVHDWITYGAGIAARARSGRPVVAHIHATEHDRSGAGENPLIAARERDGLHAADHVISNSGALKDQVVARYGLAADKVTVVHWGIDDDYDAWSGGRASPLPHEAPVVLFLGRVTRQKGPDHFIEMAGRVARHVPDARFIMAGSGDLLPRVIERAAELGIADRVHFAGAVHGLEVDRAFQAATVCVMPSVSEPFGLVALESIRAGTPCVVPRTSGVAEVVRNAFKVDYWDLDELTNTVVALLRYPALRQEMSERGLEELGAPRFSLDEPARLTETVYRRATRHDA